MNESLFHAPVSSTDIDAAAKVLAPFAVRTPLLSPPATPPPVGFFPAVSFQLSVNAVGPEFGAMVTAAEVQVPLGPPVGHVIATTLPATSRLSDAVSQLSAVPPELVKIAFAVSVTVQLEEVEMKFENVPLGAFGQGATPLGESVTSLACGATGAVAGRPGVPEFDQTRV